MEREKPENEDDKIDAITSLKERQTQLLFELEELGQKPSSPGRRRQIQRTKQEYNTLLDLESRLISPPRCDPLQILPPELWKDILPNSVDEILVLTMVSSSWCHKLISTPYLWTNIVLDVTVGDYMAKALTCIHLSQQCEIYLHINLSLDQWSKVGSQFIAERARIHTLSIPSQDEISGLELLPFHDARFQPTLEILTSFTDLPALRYARLDFLLWSQPNLSVLRGMPSLVEATYLTFTPEMIRSMSFPSLEQVSIYSFSRETVEALAQLHHLKHIFLSHGSTEYTDHISDSSRSCLRFVSGFVYRGRIMVDSPRSTLVLYHALLCIGQNLQVLSAGPIHICAMPNLLVSLDKFPRLKYLSLRIDQQPSQDALITEGYKVTLTSVRRLKLSFRKPGNDFTVPLNLHGQEEQEEQANTLQNVEHLFLTLTSIVPDLEELHLSGWFMVDAALKYADTLQSLQELFVTSEINQVDEPLYHNSGTEMISPYIIPFNFLDHLKPRLLHYLQVSTAILGPNALDVLEMHDRKRHVHSSRYTISSVDIPSVTTLALVVEHPLLMDLTTFSNMRRLILTARHCLTWSSDFFEELILQPNRWPALEHISLTGGFLEWDILLLMLERRNFIAQPGVKHIKTLELTKGIPYKIFHPLTQLLGGRFPDRGPISDFSILEVGVHLWDKDVQDRLSPLSTHVSQL